MQVNTKIASKFRRRRMPISPDYRPLYKISVICLILEIASSAGKSSLNRLHFFIWALKSETNRIFVNGILDSKSQFPVFTWGVEPALNKALAYGTAEGLFMLEGSKYTLSETGKEFCKKIRNTAELFIEEIEFLNSIGKRGITESIIDSLTKKAI